MGIVGQLREKATVVIDLDGLEFLCYRPTASMAIQAYGAGAIRIVESEGGQKAGLNPEVFANGYDAMRKLLDVAMISPTLGDRDDEENDIVCWETLGDYATRLFNALMGEENADVENFGQLSEVQTE